VESTVLIFSATLPEKSKINDFFSGKLVRGSGKEVEAKKFKTVLLTERTWKGIVKESMNSH
jgi:hypothetical protein